LKIASLNLNLENLVYFQTDFRGISYKISKLIGYSETALYKK